MRKPTLNDDDGRVFECDEDLVQGPLVVSSYLVVADPLLLFGLQNDGAQIWLLGEERDRVEG